MPDICFSIRNNSDTYRKSRQEFLPLEVAELCNVLTTHPEVDFTVLFLPDARASTPRLHVDLLRMSNLL